MQESKMFEIVSAVGVAKGMISARDHATRATLNPILSASMFKQKKPPRFWFQVWMYSANIIYFFPGVVPFRFAFDPMEGKLFIKENRVHKVFCTIMHCFCLYIVFTTLREALYLVWTSDDPLSYFDFGFTVASFVHSLHLRFNVFFRKKQLLQFLQHVNETPLLEYASDVELKKRTLKWFLLVFTVSTPAVLCYYCSISGIDAWNLTVVQESIKTQAITVLGEFEEIPTLIMIFIAFANLFEAFNMWMADIFGMMGIFFMLTVTDDVTKQFEKVDQMDATEGMEIIEEFGKLMKHFNQTMGFVCCTYSCYCNSFYAIHLVDLLNDPDLRNRYLISTQLMGLGYSYFNAARISIKCRKITKWLRRNATHISQQKMSFLRFNLENDIYSVGSFFKITPDVVGNLCSIVLTFAIVAIGFKSK